MQIQNIHMALAGNAKALAATLADLRGVVSPISVPSVTSGW